MRGRLSDQRHAHPERGEHAGVLEPDHAGPDHRERAGEAVQDHRVVAGEDAPAVEGDVRVPRRGGPRGDDDVAPGQGLASVAPRLVHDDRVRVEERAVAGVEVHAVAHELVAHHVDLVAHDVVGAEAQVLDADVLLDRVRGSVEPALAVAAEGHRRLAQGLRRDRPGGDAHPADGLGALDHGDPRAELGGLDRRALAARARSDGDQVVVEGGAVRRAGVAHRSATRAVPVGADNGPRPK
jgi:hypothetical protein